MLSAKHGTEAARQHEEQAYEIFRTECLIASISEEMAGNSHPETHSEQTYSQDD